MNERNVSSNDAGGLAFICSQQEISKCIDGKLRTLNEREKQSQDSCLSGYCENGLFLSTMCTP